MHFNQDGAAVVKLDEHPLTIIDHEVFGLLIKMKMCLLLTFWHPYLTLVLPFILCLSVGVNMFFICIIVYLYGDLAIYAAAVPISLMEVSW